LSVNRASSLSSLSVFLLSGQQIEALHIVASRGVGIIGMVGVHEFETDSYYY
jgi:hypothetical protein